MVDLSHNVAWEYCEGPSLGKYVQRELVPSAANELRSTDAASCSEGPGGRLANMLGQRAKTRQRRYTRLDETDEGEDGDDELAGSASRVPELGRGKRHWCVRSLQLMVAIARWVLVWCRSVAAICSQTSDPFRS